MKLIRTQFPKQGQVACAIVNFEHGLYMFSKFTKEDEEIAKTNKTEYYVIATENQYSLEDFEGIFYPEDAYYEVASVSNSKVIINGSDEYTIHLYSNGTWQAVKDN